MITFNRFKHIYRYGAIIVLFTLMHMIYNNDNTEAMILYLGYTTISAIIMTLDVEHRIYYTMFIVAQFMFAVWLQYVYNNTASVAILCFEIINVIGHIVMTILHCKHFEKMGMPLSWSQIL